MPLGNKKIIVASVIIFVLGVSVYFNYQYFKVSKDPQKIAQAEIKSLVEQVSKLVVLPVDETPTVATVSDPEVLKNQPFFANAQKDDKVLIFANAQKAVLYRPSVNKIIELAPINIGNNAQNIQENTTPEPTPEPSETEENI